MAEDKPSLHIDTDWKRQAQEEKRKLAEEEAKKKAAEAVTAAPSAATIGVGPAAAPRSSPAGPGAAASGPRGRSDKIPEASFTGLVQSLVTQILYYLGDLSARGSEPQVNLDMAKHQIDLLGILEEKTRGNLAADEKIMLDGALYETRMRYVSVASQYT
jgi:hypothetical protein